MADINTPPTSLGPGIWTMGRWVAAALMYLAATMRTEPESVHPKMKPNVAFTPTNLPPNHCNSTSSHPPKQGKANILLIGDSIDRHMVQDTCTYLKLKPESWDSKEPQRFQYLTPHTNLATNFCHSDDMGFSLGFLHLYGSKSDTKEGQDPYAHGHTNTANDPYADTTLRIQKGIELYTEERGKPDFVIYRVDLWDMHTVCTEPERGETSQGKIDTILRTYMCNPPTSGCGGLCADLTVDPKHALSLLNENQRIEFIQKSINNNLDNIKQIKQLLPDAVVGTHTIPTIAWGHDLFFELQNGLRYIAFEQDLVLYDFHLLMNTVNPIWVLRDVHHPSLIYSTNFGMTILSSYCSWFCLPCAKKVQDIGNMLQQR
jgi:hypothetical protein